MVEERWDDMLAAMHERSKLPNSEEIVDEQNPVLENSQVTDARCAICGEREVRIKDVHDTGYGATEERECLKCGHVWYASSYTSRDSISSVATEDQVNTTSPAIGSSPLKSSIERGTELPSLREGERPPSRPPETLETFSSPQTGLSEVEEINTPSEAHYKQGSQSSKTSQESSSVEMIASLLQYASTGEVEEVERILDGGLVEIDKPDYDGRTALHLAASEGNYSVVKLLLERNAKVNPIDRWGDTPLQDAMRYIRGTKEKQHEYHQVQKALTNRGGQGTIHEEDEQGLGTLQREQLEQEGQMEQLREEYEIARTELDLDNATTIGQGSYGVVKSVKWRGTKVAAKMILQRLAQREEIIKEFRMELLLLHSLRHPNIVEFLGAVTERENFIIVTEYLPNVPEYTTLESFDKGIFSGDLHEIIQRRGRIHAKDAVKYALDIARGMNYLHQHKPKAIVHRDLKPRNLLQDAAGHLKVADFGLSKLLEPRPRKERNEAYNMTGGTGTFRYMAPEVFLGLNYNKSVDVFSFAIIVQEMFEGSQLLLSNPGHEVAHARAQSGKRSPFFARTYPPKMKDLLRKCWDEEPTVRPTFKDIIGQLEAMQTELNAMSRWKPAVVTNISATLSRWVQHRPPLDKRAGSSRRGDRSHRGGRSSPPSEDTNSTWSLVSSSLPPSSFDNSSGSVRDHNPPPQADDDISNNTTLA